jgi:hypothetical protein
MIGYRKTAPTFLPDPNEYERVIWYRGIRWTVTGWRGSRARVTHIHRPNGKGYIPQLPLVGTVDLFIKSDGKPVTSEDDGFQDSF